MPAFPGSGIDLNEWPDRAREPKIYDFLVYNKIRWDHDELEKTLLTPILQTLNAKGLTYHLVRYKMHDHATYKELLGSARSMLFLCEHETQGLAYQEAMASGLPVLAWDNGFWADPLWKKFMPSAPPASSAPFFSPACGDKFRNISEFENILDLFMSRRSTYKPRDYVAKNLNMQTSANLYAEQYFGLVTV